jgi:putative intracellular protease/amidase
MTEKNKKFLFVLTSHATLGDSGEKTGFHLSEMADPYYILEEHGFKVDLASIKGGEPPIDPASAKETTESGKRFQKDTAAMKKLKSTLKIDDVDMSEYAGIYMAGGHGTMWDFPSSKGLQKAIEDAWKKDKVVAAVCHGPAAFVNAKNKEGEPLVKNRRVNSFTDEEERLVKKDKVVPFLLETRLHEQGGLFEHEQPFQGLVVEDSNLITGQNPKSASLVANGILRTLGISPYVGKEQAA